MGILGIHHIQLAMPRDGEMQAIAFYEGILGIPRIEKPRDLAVRGGCWFETDLIRIHLGIEEDFRAARKAHPALLIHDLPEWRRRLLDAGVPVIDDEPLPGFERFYAYDPFGNRLEFLAEVA